MTTLAAVVAGIQDVAETITNVRLAPDSLPDPLDITAGPIILTYPESGTINNNSAGWSSEVHTIAIVVNMVGGSYRQSYPVGLAITIDLIRAIIDDPTIAGNIITYGKITYQFNLDQMIWTIRLVDCKINTTW